ncbi:MAG: hypothetical protein V4616_07905 [Bacteroidota bacterium]
MKKIYLSLAALLCAGAISAQIHNDLCKEGSYPVPPYILKNNTTGANLQLSEQSPGAGNTHWNVVVTKPGRSISIAVSPDYCTSNPKITKPTLRVYDDLNEQSLDFYYNQCTKPQPVLGPTTQKLKYSGTQCGTGTSVTFLMPPFGGKEPNGNAYYDIQIDGAAPGAYVLSVAQEDQFGTVSNDFVCGALILTANGSVTGSNCMATALCDEPIGAQWKDANKDNTRWYYFDATSTGSILTLGSLTFDGQIAVYDRGLASAATCLPGGQAHNALVQVASSDCNSNTTDEIVYVPTIAGHRYKVQVDGNQSAGNFSVNLNTTDILHPNDAVVNSGDTLRITQNFPGVYSTSALPGGVSAKTITSGNNAELVVSNISGSDKSFTVYFSVGCQRADSMTVTVKGGPASVSEQGKSFQQATLKGRTLFFQSGHTVTGLSVYETTGRLIEKVQISGNEFTLPVSVKGVVLISFETNEGTVSSRYLVE